jgi:Fanconi anemia group D2 protein
LEVLEDLQVLGSLITHIGSGISSEIGAALDTLWLITKRKPQELLPMSTFLNGEYSFVEDIIIAKRLKPNILLESL